MVYIEVDDHEKHFSKTELIAGDLVFTKIGAGIGDVAVLPSDFDRYNFSQNVAGASVNQGKVDGHYLLAYLATKWGRQQLLRYMMPSGQGKLELRDIKKLRIARFESDEVGIAELVVKSEKALRESRTNQIEAQHLLEAELGLDKLLIQKPVGYTVNFSDLESSRRSDAEFFHVGYESFLAAAKNFRLGWQPLRNVTKQTTPNFDGRKEIVDVSYIEIGDVSVSNGSYQTSMVAPKDLPANAKIQLSGGEILISLVRPTRGAIAIVDDELTHTTVCSGAFFVCTAKEVSRREIIWLYLRCMKSVFEKYCGGTSYPTIDSRYIARFPVPLFDDALARRVQELVVQSKNALSESVHLLDQAKARVEKLIEEAVKP
ncbi:hypothetical protein [Candidatus Aalborgicola defluviihabitans]|uniref:hypothetical protein n=1 Tax=Candidatus Aalborgicola defluviihabitans TaxID=3386187 RepID=UPI00390A0D8F|nr:hypothetical protein [Burkholderiales bacterium]